MQTTITVIEPPQFIQRISTYIEKNRTMLLFALAVFLASVGARYVLYVFSLSGPIFWPSIGIAFAAMILYGYRATLPIGFAIFAGSLVNAYFYGSTWWPITSVVAAFSQILGILLGTYFLRKYKFNPIVMDIRDMGLFLGSAYSVAVITPAVSALYRYVQNSFFGFENSYPNTSWWVGISLSIVVITPLILRLSQRKFFASSYKLSHYSELAVTYGLLVLNCVVLFGTPYVTVSGVSLIITLLLILSWFAFRFPVQKTIVALFTMTVISFLGAFFGTYEMPEGGLSARILSTEIFDLLLATFFFVIAALVEQRKTATEALSLQTRQLEEALSRLHSDSRAKNEFLATLAHELRNPLALFTYSIDLLRMQSLRSNFDTKEILDSLEGRVKVMSRLLDDLLNLARIGEKRFELSLSPMDLKQTISRVITSIAPTMQAKGQHFAYSYPSQPVTLMADQIRIEQIIQNLLENAVKYTQPYGSIRLDVTEVGWDKIEISVSDTGKGIAKQFLKDIFEPFVQAHGTVGVHTNGIGIGLSVCRKLTEMHGGTIEVKSAGEGKGSTFIVSLPRQKIEHGHDKKAAPAFLHPTQEYVERKHWRGGGRITDARGLTLLIVDDERVIANGLQRLLEGRGYTTAVAYDGRKALEIVDTFTPDAIILDIGLPGMSGYAVAKELHSKMDTPPYLIALTGFGQPEDKREAERAGFDFHLTKPASVDEIVMVLKKIPAFRLT